MTPVNPFYPVLEAFGAGSAEIGSVVGGCRLQPLTSCAGANLGKAKLTGAILTSSNLRRLQAPGATLAGVAVSLSHLEGADLSGADLTLGGLAEMRAPGADLREAKLAGADLSEAILAGARLGGPIPASVTLCNTVMPDGSVANPQQQCEPH